MKAKNTYPFKITVGLVLIVALLFGKLPVFAVGRLQASNPGTASLVSWWSLNEENGTRNDCFGANHLTDNNTVTYAAGKQGNAALFAFADSEYLSIADNASLSMSNNADFTIGGWVNLSTLGSLRALIAKGASSGANKDFEYFIEYDSSASAFYFNVGNGTTYGAVTSTTPSANTWYFLVAWHDSASDTLYLQVNDGTPASASYSGGSYDSSNMMTIGKLGAYNGGYVNGSIDEVFLYKRLLTSDERSWLYNAGNGRNCTELSTATPTPTPSETNPGISSLTSCWTLNETTGTRSDSHAANHLTSTNASYDTGKQGNAAKFTPNQYLSITDNASLSMGNNVDFTIGGWVNLTQLNALRTILSKGTGGANKNYEYLLEYDTTSGKFYFSIGNGTTYGEVVNTTPTTSTWYFLMAWYNSATDTMYLQVNNGTPASVTYTYGSYDSSHSLTIGKLAGYNGGYMNGLIDEMFLYKRVLTDAERSWLYNSGNGRTYTELLPPTPTPTTTPTFTPTNTPTATFTPTRTFTPTATATFTPTNTIMPQIGGTGTCWAGGPVWPSYTINFDIVTYPIPANISSSEWVSAIESAAQTWNDVVPSHFVLNRQIGNINTISYEQTQDVSYLAGTATWSTDLPDPYYDRAYTKINPLKAPFDFLNPPAAGAINLQNLMTHEFGHWIYLDDLPSGIGCGDSIMSGVDRGNGTATSPVDLSPFDENGLNYKYP